MDPSEEMCKSLVKWLQKIVPNRSKNVGEICDGVAMLDALMQIAPEYFNKLEPKIKKDVGPNWRLRISNLKKIIEAVIEYYQDILSLLVLQVGRPDVNKIAEINDPVQLAKLLRLILGCAINCDRKQDYITKIMEMEESVQQSIMQAIQQLEDITGGPGRSGFSLPILDGNTDARILKLVSELDAANETRETLLQQCRNLEHQLQTTMEEKQSLIEQNQDLLANEERVKGTKDSESRLKIENLKENLYKVEVMRDQYQEVILLQERQISQLQEKTVELQAAANASARLQDEVDALTESAGKVADLEAALTSYKKKLQNYQDLKSNMKKIEDENMEYLQKNMELEEELTRSNGWRTQCDGYRAQLVEIQTKLDEETQRADTAQFKSETLDAKIVALLGEKERLLLERDALREENEELKFGQTKKESGAAVAQELTPIQMKERLRFLEKENKTMRSTTQELEAKQAQLDTALSRIEILQQQNRTANQNVFKLESQLEELKSSAEQNSSASSSSTSTVLKDYKAKIVTLQEALHLKEGEMQTAQSRYNRNLEKAREVAQHLDMKNNGVDSSLRHSQLKDLEERLLVTSFFKLGWACQREAIDERMAVLSGQGQSFLERQRQPTPRKQIQRFKSK